ncbi:hypothetical protein BOSEA1005_30670 [Hyphomicrobiales bacterium]|nr:hypothetical protein BOSEA1005_30670 [Hyphomicrobiales bacterium]
MQITTLLTCCSCERSVVLLSEYRSCVSTHDGTCVTLHVNYREGQFRAPLEKRLHSMARGHKLLIIHAAICTPTKN